MATLKKSAKKKRPASKPAADSPHLQAQAEQLSKRLGESAQQVWLAGVGAFSRAQAEGGKLFESLVKEGVSLEQLTRKVTNGRVDAVRDVVENKVGQARERAADTWDRLEKVFEDRVQRALRRLEVPSREDLSALLDRVDSLNSELRKLNKSSAKASKSAPASKPRKTAKTAKTVKSAPATRKTTTRKTTKKKAS